jgi:hypothetical protein
MGWYWYFWLGAESFSHFVSIIITHVACVCLTLLLVVSVARFVRVRGRILLKLRPTGRM